MAVDPAIIGAAIDVAGNVGQGISDIAVAYSSPQSVQRNRRMLRELQRREALGLLGLTPDEMALAEQQTMGAARSAVGSAQAETARRLQSSGLGGAADVAALAGQDAALRALGETQGAIGTQLAQADVAAREAQRQEIEARMAYDAQVRANRARAVGNLLTGGLIGGSGAAQTATALGPQRSPAPAPAPQGAAPAPAPAPAAPAPQAAPAARTFEPGQQTLTDPMLDDAFMDLFGLSSY